jgi:hypothetical protein
MQPQSPPLGRLSLVLLLAVSACDTSADPAAAPELADTAQPSGANVAPAGGLALIEPAHPAHPGWVDLGDLPLGVVHEHVIPLKNLEDRPLTVRSIRAGCSCTLPSISYVGDDGQRVVGDPTGPGDVITLPPLAEAELVLRVDTKRAPVQNKPKLIQVRIVTNSELEPYLTVDARLLVVAAFRCAPTAVDLGRVPLNGGGRGATRVFPGDDSGRQITGVASVPEGLEALVSESYQLGLTAWDLEVRVQPPITPGYRTHQVQLSTTGPDGEGEGEPYTVEVRLTGVADVEIRPTRLLLRPLTLGELPRGEVQLFSHLTGHRLLIEGATVEGPGAEKLLVELRPDLPDDDGRSATWTIVLQASKALGPDPMMGVLKLTLDDPQHPELTVPYVSLGQS